MLFNATFNNISAISQWLVLLVEETGVPWENHWHATVTDKLYHIMLYRVQLAWTEFDLTSFSIGYILLLESTNLFYSKTWKQGTCWWLRHDQSR
jgi:hypothetical protein